VFCSVAVAAVLRCIQHTSAREILAEFEGGFNGHRRLENLGAKRLAIL
jgi:hypothetical protein